MNKTFNRFFLLTFFSVLSLFTHAQRVTISGFVNDNKGEPMLGASVILPEFNEGTITDNNGHYSLSISTDKPLIVHCTFLGYKMVADTILLESGESRELNFILYESASQLESVTIRGIQERENTLTRINMKSIRQVPSSSGNFEDILKSMSGVSPNNELSSQYNVRGGNFDENLIYVNDIEIYRPLLVQSAVQEGLSFINPDMVSSVQFSAGGFKAEYGDKMASVLDVKYKKPTKIESGFYASLLGAGANISGISKSKKLTFNTGFRYKTTSYLLNSLDVQGEYVPRFGDIQALVTYELTPKSSITLLGNYSTNRFNLVPETRSTDFGTISQSFNFTVFYEGKEKDRFDSYMGAVSYNYTPNNNINLKFIGSIFDTDEEVNYDILSEYFINAKSGGGSNDTLINIGTGASLEHARNNLQANIYSLEHRGIYTNQNASWKWGLKVQNEVISDKISEWRMLDSAGYSTPNGENSLELDYSYKAVNKLNSMRYQLFLQNSTTLYSNAAEIDLTIGARINYWDLNNEFLFSPRASVSILPYWDRKVQFYFATGIYNQPPFYKELKKYDGQLFPETKTQKSVHFIAGTDYHFKAWDRPFVFTTEIYYKNYSRLIPYQIDNIKLTYLPEYKAKGYATGIDFRVNGEFVPGAESWFSLSLLQTMEDVYNDYYTKSNGEVVHPGYYRRPSDQTLTFSIFFQDYLPTNENYKVHLMVNYGSGLPYSGPNPDRPSQNFLLNQYRRIDLGFSRYIKRNKNKRVGLHDIWLTFEILNMIDAPNMVSYHWVRTVENNEGYLSNYAVPNYLTGRRFNIKISAKL